MLHSNNPLRSYFCKQKSNPLTKIKTKQESLYSPFVMQYNPAVPNVKPRLMNSWHFIKQQPLLNELAHESKTLERLKHVRRSRAGR